MAWIRTPLLSSPPSWRNGKLRAGRFSLLAITHLISKAPLIERSTSVVPRCCRDRGRASGATVGVVAAVGAVGVIAAAGAGRDPYSYGAGRADCHLWAAHQRRYPREADCVRVGTGHRRDRRLGAGCGGRGVAGD